MFNWKFRKGKGNRDQIANILWIIKKAREFQKTSTFASLKTLKHLTVWITTNCRKFFKKWEYQTPHLPLEKPVCRSRSDSYIQTWNNGLIQNWERSRSKLYIVALLI